MEPILAHMFPEMTANLLVPVAILIYLFLLDWRMALISLIVLPIGFALQMGCMKGFAEKYKEQIRITKKLNTTLVEYVNGIEVIKAFNQSATSYQKFTDAVNENAAFYVNWMHDTQKYMASSRAVMPTVLATVLLWRAFLLAGFSICVCLCYDYDSIIGNYKTVIGRCRLYG